MTSLLISWWLPPIIWKLCSKNETFWGYFQTLRKVIRYVSFLWQIGLLCIVVLFVWLVLVSSEDTSWDSHTINKRAFAINPTKKSLSIESIGLHHKEELLKLIRSLVMMSRWSSWYFMSCPTWLDMIIKQSFSFSICSLGLSSELLKKSFFFSKKFSS